MPRFELLRSFMHLTVEIDTNKKAIYVCRRKIWAGIYPDPCARPGGEIH